MNRSVATALTVVLTGLLASAALGQDHERSIGVSVQRYTPKLDSARDVYGSATATSFTYEYLSEKNSFVRAGVGFLKHSRNGYGRHFVNGPLATQSLMPLELSVGYRAALSDEGDHAIVVGVGGQYLGYWERYPGQDRIAAQGIGAILYMGPEFAITKRIRLGLEYRVLLADVQVRTPEARYDVDLGGSFLQLALRRVL
ncbi:hypothetical protein HOK31_28625 [Candidatus Poribacteria bacterium]|nr:hypothetical protein [Candidatus Poribacteria bacterium]